MKTTGMKLQDIIFLLSFLTIAAPLSCFSQQGVVATGGEAAGTGGTMSFSTGRPDFMYFSDEGGSIQFGLQQAFFYDDEVVVPGERFLTTEDLFQGEDQCFDATETIVLAQGDDTFIVESGTGAELIAGNNILMMPGTAVERGGYMHARITTDGQFCDPEIPMVASLPGDHADKAVEHEPLPSSGKDNTVETFFRVYPNPTTGDLTVEIVDQGILDQPVVIEVIGMRGEVIKRTGGTNSHYKHRLSLKGHQPGLYMVRVQCGGDFGTERVIKR